MAWRFNEHAPVYVQIADKLRGSIMTGEFPPGGQIPPVRQIALAAAVNPNTVQRAIAELEAEGLLYPRSTQGCFVTEDEEVLARIRKEAAERLVTDFVSFAAEMSITREELIKMIESLEAPAPAEMTVIEETAEEVNDEHSGMQESV